VINYDRDPKSSGRTMAFGPDAAVQSWAAFLLARSCGAAFCSPGTRTGTYRGPSPTGCWHPVAVSVVGPKYRRSSVGTAGVGPGVIYISMVHSIV